MHLVRHANSAGLGDALQPGGDIDAVAEDAVFVIDDVAEIDADTELHALLGLDAGVALAHGALNGDRALDRVHDAGKLGQDAVTRRVDDPAVEIGDHRQDHGLVALEIAHRARLVGAHQRAVPGNVSGQDRCEPARLALRHGNFPKTTLATTTQDISGRAEITRPALAASAVLPLFAEKCGKGLGVVLGGFEILRHAFIEIAAPS